MRSLSFAVFGLMWWQIAAPAQAISNYTGPDAGRAGAVAKTGVVGTDALTNAATYEPLTASERWRRYLISAYGPEAIVRAAAGAGISQWNDTPKEWKQGSEAFGERFGNSLARHVLRETLESGAAAVLHEDNRYFPSTDTGFWKRTEHAVGSVFVTRNDEGQEHFAYSRFGAALGSSFISRAWQPPSEDSPGNAAVTFGITMAADMGWNVFKEFCPSRLGRQF
jgi:hypothetical protein